MTKNKELKMLKMNEIDEKLISKAAKAILGVSHDFRSKRSTVKDNRNSQIEQLIDIHLEGINK